MSSVSYVCTYDWNNLLMLCASVVVAKYENHYTANRDLVLR